MYTINILNTIGNADAICDAAFLIKVGPPNRLALTHPGLFPTPHRPDHLVLLRLKGYLSFSYQELVQITGNFDDRPTSEGGNRLGEGGFGTVYKGFVDDKPVAVKKLSPVSEDKCLS